MTKTTTVVLYFDIKSISSTAMVGTHCNAIGMVAYLDFQNFIKVFFTSFSKVNWLSLFLFFKKIGQIEI